METLRLSRETFRNGPVNDFYHSVLHYIEHTQADNPDVRNHLLEILDLACTLAILPNHPENRMGKEKAEFIASWLKQNGISDVRVTPVENLDPSRTANQGEAWYVVEAIIGDKYYRGDDVTGTIIVHHDQISPKEVIDFQLIDNNLHHSWILDDSIHLAAAMIEAARFQKFWNENHAGLGLKGRVIVDITDAEDVNTLGYRALLKQKLERENLLPLDFMIVGESTGREHSKKYTLHKLANKNEFSTAEVPGVAYTSRGKNSGFIESDVNGDIYNLFKYYVSNLRHVQRFLYHSSKNNNAPKDRELLNPTALSATVINITQEKLWSFWEARTNERKDVYESFNNLVKVFSDNDKNFDYSEDEIIPFNFDIHELFYYDRSNRVLNINFGHGSHPGNYNPFDQNDILSIVELVMANLDEIDRVKLKNITIGDKSKTNVVPGFAILEFTDDIDWENTFLTIKKINHAEVIKQFESEGRLLSRMNLKVSQDQNVPPRNHMVVSEDKWWVVETALENMINQVRSTLGVEVSEDQILRAFDFMHDGGVTTMDMISERVWPNGSQGAVIIGVGNAKLLHGDEYLTRIGLIMGYLQYKDLLQNLFLRAHKEKYGVKDEAVTA